MIQQAEDRDFYRKLGSPIRREIVRLLGERGQMGATALNESVNVSAGRFYYHLDFLGDLVTRDKDRRYILSERGKLAYQMLMGNSFTEGNQTKRNSIEGTLMGILAPNLLLNHIFSIKAVGLPLAGLILLSTFLVQSNALLMPSLLSLSYSPGSTTIWISAVFVANFAILFAFCTLASYTLGKRGGDVDLFISLALSQIPLAIYAALSLFMPTYFRGSMALIPFQVWSMLILAVTLAKAKKMSYLASGLIVLCLGYVTAVMA